MRVAIVVLADVETHGDLGRLFNALMAVKEFKQAGDDVKLIFDGAGTAWIPRLVDPVHKAHGLFESVKDKIAGACGFCAGAFGVSKEVQDCGVPLLHEYEGHPSFRHLLDDGYQIITF